MTIAIGDIHGCARTFDRLLDEIELTRDDRIIALGDYVDRGPDSKSVLDRLIQLHSTGQLIALLGNHDIVMLDALQHPQKEAEWRDFGGDTTIDSYAPPGVPGKLADIPLEHRNFLENHCLNSYETETAFFVHANADPDLPIAEQPDTMLFWEKFHNPPPHHSGKTMICGHTSQKSGDPVHIGHAICIDTWAWGGGWLTALEVESGKLWQANRAGRTRIGWIEDYRQDPK